jgi:hypothetical protein
MRIFLINILFFNFFKCLLHVSNPRVRLQEDGCMYSYVTGCFTCISISSLVDRRVCSMRRSIPQHRTHSSTYKTTCKTYRTVTVYTTVLLKLNHRFRNVEDIKKLKY